MRVAWYALCPALMSGRGVVADLCWMVWIRCEEADSMIGCEMDGGPCVVFLLDLYLVGGMHDRFAGMWVWSWL